MTLLIRNAVVDGKCVDISVDGSRIAAVGPGLPGEGAEKIIDCGGHLAATVPFYNTHTHSAMTLLRGYADDLPLFTWLNEHIWPAEAKLDAHDIYTGTRLGILEMIKSGCCYFNEMYFHPEETIRAAKEMGIRADVGLIHISLPGSPLDKNADQLIEEAEQLRADPLPETVRLAIAPHAVYTVRESAMHDMVEAAEALGSPIHIHCSETQREVEDCRREHEGLSPVAYLHAKGLLRPGTVLGHCVHLDGRDRELIASSGAVISHCPVSNLKLCSGMFDFPAAQSAGCIVTIGTDGAASNNALSMVEEVKFAALLAKIRSGDPTAGKDRAMLECATVNGARSAGVDAGIAPGKAADILLVELNDSRMVGDYSFTANLVYSADSSVMHTLICSGKIIMEDHHVPGEEEIIAEARACCDKFRRN